MNGTMCLDGVSGGLFFFLVYHCPKTTELVDDGCRCFPAHSLFQLHLCCYRVEVHMLTAGSVVLAIFFSTGKTYLRDLILSSFS